MSSAPRAVRAAVPHPACVAVVKMPPEVEYANAEGVNALMAAALVAGTTTVIVDFSATTFCDTAGLREMVLAKRLALATRIDLRLVVPGSLTRIFKLTGLDGVIPLYPTLGEALAPDSAADEGEHPA